jgi:hypothetical protein
MSAAVFPYDERERRLKAYVRTAKTVHLFVNDIEPTDQTVPEQFTEMSGVGYAPVRLLKSGWSIMRVDDAARAVSLPAEFIFADPGAFSPSVRGFYALDDAGDLFMSQRFDMPFDVKRPGDLLKVTLAIDSVPARPGL